MITIALTAFLFLAPPSVNELPIFPDSQSIEAELIRSVNDAQGLGMEVMHLEQYEARETRTNKLEFVESKIVLTPKDGGEEIKLSIWMPNKPLADNFILVSRPGIITGNTVMLAHELLQSM